MKIEIIAENGFINTAIHGSETGDATLIIAQVTLDDGKPRLIPYEANKTIAQLVRDVKSSMKVEMGPAMLTKSLDKIVDDINKPLHMPESMTKRISNGIIEREDIVKCVKILPRDEGSDIDLVVGNEYRVIGIIKQGREVIYYEVLDDALNNKLRIPIFPQEIELVRKFIPPAPRKQVYEITQPCPKCGDLMSLELNGSFYEGECEKCKQKVSTPRKVNV